MRTQDLERFETPYSVLGVDDLAGALGLKIGAVRTLRESVVADLDVKLFGIGWWRLAIETKTTLQQRILVSDYLIDALQGVESNLVDLQLHFLELQDSWAREADFVKDATRVGPDGLPVVKMPPRVRPIDDVIHRLVDLHTSGVFRAIGSTLDCLASVVIGVGGIETNILRGDWATLIDRIFPALKDDGTPGRKLQLELREEITTQLAVGQKEWDRWSSDFRNMQVHRGPRMKISTLRPDNSKVDEHGARVIRTHTIHQLTRDPELSEMESFVVGAKLAPVLTEDAHISVDGVIADLTTLVGAVASTLMSLWKTRQVSPQTLVQPVGKQWPKVRTSPYRTFVGYSPEQTPYRPSALTANPAFVRRLHAAAMGVEDAKKTWP